MSGLRTTTIRYAAIPCWFGLLLLMIWPAARLIGTFRRRRRGAGETHREPDAGGRLLARIFAGAVRISTVLCVLLCVLWIRSYFAKYDLLSYPLNLTARDGLLHFSWRYEWNEGPLAPKKADVYAATMWVNTQKLQLAPLIPSPQKKILFNHAGLLLAHYENWIDITNYQRRPGEWMHLHTKDTFGTIPFWTLFLLAAAVPLIRVGQAAKMWRRERRRARGLCPTCGYDLRATSHRCPECGTLVPQANELQRTDASHSPDST